MTRYALVCLLLGSMSWCQTTDSRSGPASQATVTEETTAHGLSHESGILNIVLDKPVITIAGLCDNPSNDDVKAPNCKTVITQAEFEHVMDAIQPKMPARDRREFALRYVDALIMAEKAEQMGLDKGATMRSK